MPPPMEGAGAKPPPVCRTPRTTARRPKRTARPTPRRARLGAPQNVAGSRATGTPADRQGPPTPAGRPTARQGRPGRPPRFCGGWRAPGPRAARELTGADPKRRGRTPTKPPPHHTPPRGQRRGGASRAIRIKGGAVRPPAGLRRLGRIPFTSRPPRRDNGPQGGAAAILDAAPMGGPQVRR